MSAKDQIQFRYALCANSKIVDIFDLSTEDRGVYECAGCLQNVIPVLGEKRQKHFRHKVAHECSAETYLHRMAKLLFERHYRDCLAKKRPFFVEFQEPVQCLHCSHGPCEVAPTYRAFDLTKAFTDIQCERRDGTLIPDLLLQTRSGEILYVEIFVTHRVSLEKLDSGRRIIEIQIQNEEDLELIAKQNLSCRDRRVNLYNFKPEPVKRHSNDLCNRRVNCFVVYPSGKCVIREELMYKFLEIQKMEKWYVVRVPCRGPSIFINELETAYKKGIKVKNCFLCRYHAKARAEQREEGFESIFCKFLKKPTASNFAADCEYYRPDPKVFGENRLATKFGMQLIESVSNDAAREGSNCQERKDDSNGDLVVGQTPENAKPYEFVGVCSFCNKVTADWAFYDGHGKCRCQECDSTLHQQRV